MDFANNDQNTGVSAVENQQVKEDVYELPPRVEHIHVITEVGVHKKTAPLCIGYGLKQKLKHVYNYALSSGGKSILSELDAYKDKEIDTFLEPQYPFVVDCVQDLMQQRSESLYGGLFIVAFVELLSDEIYVPTDGFQSNYLCNRYATLL
ncbi:hypothetical protein H5410_022429 [Solanum commersonii]|uniref:Uncharacterized protein n=1 Tax=Solanum commersonii TaxID=4109 RepID=A0A9J5ZHZ0_SOLCO|nr:hypothetical protein H5410_022429 [Solanum commersonii]